MSPIKIAGAAVILALAFAPADAATAKKAPTAKASAADPGNLNGVWLSARFTGGAVVNPGLDPKTIRTVEGKDPPLLPWAAEITQRRLMAMKAGRPEAGPKAKCLPAGLPQSMTPPASLPIQMLVQKDQVTILFEEFNNFRIIHMNRKHAEDPDPGYFGDSVGHWEGDTLVVDTIGLTDKTAIDNVGIPHTDQLHVVERFHRTGKDGMEILTTLDDPKAYTAPWTIRSSFRSVPGTDLAEYYCDNDRNVPTAEGVSVVQMPGAK